MTAPGSGRGVGERRVDVPATGLDELLRAPLKNTSELESVPVGPERGRVQLDAVPVVDVRELADRMVERLSGRDPGVIEP